MSWESDTSYHYDPSAFIFSITGKTKHQLKNANGVNAVYHKSDYGPTFGSGFDIYICNSANSLSTSYSKIGYSYDAGNFTSTSTTYLAGGSTFNVYEIEVYSVNP